MNIAEYYRLEDWLAGDSLEIPKITDQFSQRLVSVLSREESSSLEIAYCYRDVLQAIFGDFPKGLIIRGDAKSLAPACEKVGCSITHDFKRIKLNLSDDFSGRYFFKNVCASVSKRALLSIPLDICLRKYLGAGFSHYHGMGQLRAVRTVLSSPKGSNIFITLPTGCGKSLIPQLMAMYSDSQKVVIVTVPTVALAIEQASTMRKIMEDGAVYDGQVLLWHSSLSADDKKKVKTDISEGRQHILFCSPEAMRGSLSASIYRAARASLIAGFVIDEAHLVDGWGADFRPDMQSIFGLIKSVRNISADDITCCAMSATFTLHSKGVVEHLVSQSGVKNIDVYASYLRPEISYQHKIVDEREHLWHLVEFVLKAPKPLIVYFNRKDDCVQLQKNLSAIGVRRVRVFTGDTTNNLREQYISDWIDDQFDIMIATSAFGVGMNKSNVRTVLHGTVPLNIDQYYQEAGRSGRDGYAAHSAIICHRKQFVESKRQNNISIIGDELGFARWDVMWRTGKVSSEYSRLINVGSKHAGIGWNSGRNHEWNWLTINLMQRAGLIEINSRPPNPPEGEGVSDADIENYFSDFWNYIPVTVLVDEHLDAKIWSNFVQKQRALEVAENGRSHSVLAEWISGKNKKPICKLFQKYYVSSSSIPEYGCGGCPDCGYEHAQPIELGYSSSSSCVSTVGDWGGKLMGWPKPGIYVQYDISGSIEKLARSWSKWIEVLISTQTVLQISSSERFINSINENLPPGMRTFWISNILGEQYFPDEYSPELVILEPDQLEIPAQIKENFRRRIVLAPAKLYSYESSDGRHRKREVFNLSDFLGGINHVTN